MRSLILLIIMTGALTIAFHMQNFAQLPVWMGGHYDSPQFVIIDTISLFDRPLFLVVYHPKFDDSDVSIRNVQIISPLSVNDSAKIKPGDIVMCHLQIWGKQLTFPQDTFQYDVVDRVTQTWWIQKHREPNWYPLLEAVRLRFDSVAILKIAAVVQDSS